MRTHLHNSKKMFTFAPEIAKVIKYGIPQTSQLR